MTACYSQEIQLQIILSSNKHIKLIFDFDFLDSTSQLLCDPNFPNCDLNQNKMIILTSAATVTKVVNISGSTLHFETECNYDESVGYVVLE